MSRRDGTTVAWHEVPGTAPPPKTSPVGYGVISIGVRTDSIRCDRAMIKRLKFMLRYSPLRFNSFHGNLVSRRFRKRSIASSSSSNITGHEPFKKSI
jgi:hypothetical protein